MRLTLASGTAVEYALDADGLRRVTAPANYAGKYAIKRHGGFRIICCRECAKRAEKRKA